jgi:hypothetical protein
MAKPQKIIIDSRAGNQRIERAIPEFMSRFGMEKDQATAVAIRLESLGRLEIDGSPINKVKDPMGNLMVPPPAIIAQVLAAMKTNKTAKRTEIRQASDYEGDVYESPFEARVQMDKPTRSNRLRKRVTRR